MTGWVSEPREAQRVGWIHCFERQPNPRPFNRAPDALAARFRSLVKCCKHSLQGAILATCHRRPDPQRRRSSARVPSHASFLPYDERTPTPSSARRADNASTWRVGARLPGCIDEQCRSCRSISSAHECWSIGAATFEERPNDPHRECSIGVCQCSACSLCRNWRSASFSHGSTVARILWPVLSTREWRI